MGYIISTNNTLLDKVIKLKHNPNVVYQQSEKHFLQLSGFFLEGYLRDNQHTIDKNNLDKLKFNWPLPHNFSGSYAFTLVMDKEIIIANDCIGVYPLYYHLQKDTFTVSNSLLELQKALHLDLDEVGKAERLFAPENSEIGSRTLLSGVKRLLPGERIVFNLEKKSIQKTYDNRLYANIHENIDDEEINRYWQILSDEIKFIESLNQTRTDIALSGGLDSRILIGAMTPKADATAYHYGKPEHYETKIAKKIAKHCGFKFKVKMDYANHFPNIERLNETIKKVGPPYSMNWYNIFDLAGTSKTNLILGDMCEALHGRNIKAFSTRESRIQNYFKHYVLDKEYTFTPATEKNFEEWKEAKVKNYWDFIHDESLLRQTNFDILTFKNQINHDLEEVFGRVAEHQVPYAELYDELFTWFTHSRIPMGRQITHCNEKFNAYAPTMSTGLMIASSNIHPNLRLNYRFNNKLFKQIKALNPLNQIPVSQVPYLSRQSPDFLQFLVWGIRSQIDQTLINRMLKYKKPYYRYRLFKSLNWVKVYQNKDMVTRLKSYFSDLNIEEDIVDACIGLALARKNLEEWPLTNFDIMSLGILNIEIDILKTAL